MDQIKERENALDFIVNSPEIALKMMERLERERDEALQLLEQSAALHDARIEELERAYPELLKRAEELERLNEEVKVENIDLCDELEKMQAERDEARREAERFRDMSPVALIQLPWEEGE